MTRHQTLLEKYAAELALARRDAESWWSDLLNRELGSGVSAKQARVRIGRRWPDGPASHPLVLNVIRNFWLACEEINQAILAEKTDAHVVRTASDDYVIDTSDDDVDDYDETPEEGEIYPHIFVFEWLMDGRRDALATFIGELSYWPIGLDEAERYT